MVAEDLSRGSTNPDDYDQIECTLLSVSSTVEKVALIKTRNDFSLVRMKERFVTTVISCTRVTVL